MSDANASVERTLGLRGATGVGVGAIVGGGVLALAGVAFATTGPGAILAFTLNGAVAFLTALSFAELASRFPQSGGTYAYARKALTVEAAFGVGWVVWFASVVAAVLYALGFAVFVVPFLEQIIRAAGGSPPAWLDGRFAHLALALAAVGYYVWSLMRSAAGGGSWATVGKVLVFIFLILGGFWVLIFHPPSMEEMTASFRPFLSAGGQGLVQAMGYTFIALQGFDLIAAVGGEVKDPERNIPRAMFLSLGAALAIYIPLLFLIVAVGSPDQPVAELAAANPEILVAVAARNFMGATGYWLIIVAGILSMLSALQANLLAASRFARTMASDRTLPRPLERVDARRGTPVPAIQLTGVTVAFLLVAVPDVAAAGAMSAVIFLMSFGLAHGIAFLVRKRAANPSPFLTPAFPLIPVVGGVACVSLGLFQALAVPAAGTLTALWMSVGAILYVTQLAPRARVVDAASEGMDPQIMRLRGRTPLLLVPIANPANASMLVTMADALAPPQISRVRLLSVVGIKPSRDLREAPPQLADAQTILGGAMGTALTGHLRPEALITVSEDPWGEIARVAKRSRPEMLLVGVGHLGPALLTGPLEGLIDQVDSDVVILRAPGGWELGHAQRILVPSGGGRDQSPIRARLLASLGRAAKREITFMRVMALDTPASVAARARRDLLKLANDEGPADAAALVSLGEDMVGEVVSRAAESDLVIMGLQRAGRSRVVFGEKVREIAEATDCPLLMISQRS